MTSNLLYVDKRSSLLFQGYQQNGPHRGAPQAAHPAAAQPFYQPAVAAAAAAAVSLLPVYHLN